MNLTETIKTFYHFDTLGCTCILSQGGAVFLLLSAGLNYAGTQHQYGESDL